jgi:hypothetical protein
VVARVPPCRRAVATTTELGGGTNSGHRRSPGGGGQCGMGVGTGGGGRRKKLEVERRLTIDLSFLKNHPNHLWVATDIIRASPIAYQKLLQNLPMFS